MQVEAHGVDTVRAAWQLANPVPVGDSSWQAEMLGAGYEQTCKNRLDDGQLVQSDIWSWQDPNNSTLRYWLRGGLHLHAEFSAPRLLDDSPVNVHLVSPAEVSSLLVDVGERFMAMTPGEPCAVFQKLARLDYAVDVAAGDSLPGVISAAMQFRIQNARKTSSYTYPGETSMTRSPSYTFRTYAKGGELEHKLTPKQRKEHVTIIQLAKEKGLTRMEFSDRKRKGLAYDSLQNAPKDFARRLEYGYPGGRVVIKGLDGLRMEIDSLDVSSQRKSSLIAFAVRYAALGRDGMQAAYSKPTFYRQQKQFIEHGLRLDDVCSYEGKLDFNPVIEQLRAA
jgi:hypothetical protein